MKRRSAIKTDLFADTHHRGKIDQLGDPLAEIESYIDFAALGDLRRKRGGAAEKCSVSLCKLSRIRS